ncbi:MAG TPA: phage tail tape measure protein [Brevundimonas sp.]|uniref:phage tail tape measure protein n=1 Tax=Brevundimonas sp. TaxID=1871086 RepID=UPI002B706791|nr:phage tail tape measure protein [Brevundimonas sp.]HRH19447.1 phage tail tape measure protein [Brevundimonas sp.]
MDGLDDVPVKAAEAAEALERLKEPAEAAAQAIEASFERAGDSLVRSLARAAADGEVTMAELARAVLAAINALAGSGGRGGLGEALASAMGSVFGGSKAEGGLVAPGAAYLVGERGPEVFRPATAGAIEPVGAGGVTVNIMVQGGPEALLRSEAQIAQALVRAARVGTRS